MKTKYKNIDSLLADHAAKQITKVNADRLHVDICQKLDKVGERQPSRPVSYMMIKWVAGLSAAAAMVMVVYIFQHDGSNGIELIPGQRAAVKLTERDTMAKVQISESPDNKYASVTIQPSVQKTHVSFDQLDRRIAQCNVTIIDQNGLMEKKKNLRPSWVIMIASQAEGLENGTDQELADIACLF